MSRLCRDAAPRHAADPPANAPHSLGLQPRVLTFVLTSPAGPALAPRQPPCIDKCIYKRIDKRIDIARSAGAARVLPRGGNRVRSHFCA